MKTTPKISPLQVDPKIVAKVRRDGTAPPHFGSLRGEEDHHYLHPARQAAPVSGLRPFGRPDLE